MFPSVRYRSLTSLIFGQVDRGRKNFSVVQVKEAKSEAWKEDLWNLIDWSAETNQVPVVKLPISLPKKPMVEAPPKVTRRLNFDDILANSVSTLFTHWGLFFALELMWSNVVEMLWSL